jgi:hypothetical protein
MILYECGICECLHRWTFRGDCREDAQRFTDPEDYRVRAHDPEEPEIRSWDDRLAEDERKSA